MGPRIDGATAIGSTGANDPEPDCFVASKADAVSVTQDASDLLVLRPSSGNADEA